MCFISSSPVRNQVIERGYRKCATKAKYQEEQSSHFLSCEVNDVYFLRLIESN